MASWHQKQNQHPNLALICSEQPHLTPALCSIQGVKYRENGPVTRQLHLLTETMGIKLPRAFPYFTAEVSELFSTLQKCFVMWTKTCFVW